MLINPRLPARALFQGFFRAGGCWKSREGVHWASIPSRDPPAPAIFRARGILCLMSRTSHPTPGPAPPLRRAPRPRRRPSPRLRARYFGISTLAPPLPRTPSAQRPPKFPDGIPSGTGVMMACLNTSLTDEMQLMGENGQIILPEFFQLGGEA